jgi:hypothetical protein
MLSHSVIIHCQLGTKPVKSAAYTSMVRPTMEYTSSVWDPTNWKKIGNLEKVQKRAARFVFNNYTDLAVLLKW